MSSKKDVVGVTVGPGAAVMNPQWTRVHGPNIQPQHKIRATNNVARTMDNVFKLACKAVGIPGTIRQASKWNNGKGAAYNNVNNIEMKGFVYPNTV